MSESSDQSDKVSPRVRRRQSGLHGLMMMLGSSYADLLLGMVRGVLVMRMIGPTGRGLMRLVDLFNKWLSNLHLGALHGLSKQLPIVLGRQDERQAQEIEEVGTSIVLGAGLLAALTMLVYALVRPDVELLTREVLACGAGIIWAGYAFTLYRIVLRAWGTYSVIAIASVVTTLSQLVLIVAGAYWYGVLGATLGWLGANLIQLFYLHIASNFKVQLRWNWSTVGHLIRCGLPLWTTIFADIALRTIDGIIVIRYLSAYHFGLYSLAMQLAGYLYRVPEGAGFVLMPRIWEKYGAKDDAQALRRQVLVPTLAAATVMPVLSGVTFILIPFLILLVVPKFYPGAYAAQVLAMGGAFLALPIAANGLLVAMNREALVTLNKLTGTALVAAGALWTMQTGGGLAQVALAAGLGYAVASFLSLSMVLAHYYPNRRRLAGELALCYIPFLWAILALKGAGAGAEILLGAAAEGGVGALVRVILFLVACSPVLWYGNHRTGMLARLKTLVKTKLAAERVEPELPTSEE